MPAVVAATHQNVAGVKKIGIRSRPAARAVRHDTIRCSAEPRPRPATRQPLQPHAQPMRHRGERPAPAALVPRLDPRPGGAVHPLRPRPQLAERTMLPAVAFLQLVALVDAAIGVGLVPAAVAQAVAVPAGGRVQQVQQRHAPPTQRADEPRTRTAEMQRHPGERDTLADVRCALAAGQAVQQRHVVRATVERDGRRRSARRVGPPPSVLGHRTRIVPAFEQPVPVPAAHVHRSNVLDLPAPAAMPPATVATHQYVTAAVVAGACSVAHRLRASHT